MGLTKGWEMLEDFYAPSSRDILYSMNLKKGTEDQNKPQTGLSISAANL